MHGINFQLLLSGLIAAGMRQPEIAQHVGCGQSTISDLMRGATKEPRYSLGQKILTLAQARGVAVVAPGAQLEGMRDAA